MSYDTTGVGYRRHFDEHAEHYAARIAPLFAPAHEHVAAWAAELPSGTTVLDVACGDGRLTAALAADDRPVIGCDSSPGLLSRAAARRTPVRWVCADAQALPLAGGSVDAVCCSLGLQVFDRPDVALAEMCRVTRSDGQLVAVLPEPASLGGAARPPASPLPPHPGLDITAEVVLTSTAELRDIETLLAVWQVAVGDLPTVPEVSPEEQVELAEYLLDRHGGRIELPQRFHAYHGVVRAP